MKEVKQINENGNLVITPELCTAYDCPLEYIYFLSKYYPDGISLNGVISRTYKHIPIDLLTWGYSFLPYTELDKEMCLDWVNIVHSRNFFISHDIQNCDTISYSSNCADCEGVWHSEEILTSNSVGYSQTVSDSSDIYGSKNIHGSSIINYSSNVIDSDHILDSQNVLNCSVIWNSESITNSYACSSCKGERLFGCNNVTGSNKIFCDGTVNDDVEGCYILNAPVSQEVFDKTFNTLVKEIVPDLKEIPIKQVIDAPYLEKTKTVSSYIAKNDIFSNELLMDTMKKIVGYNRESETLLYKLTLSPFVFSTHWYNKDCDKIYLYVLVSLLKRAISFIEVMICYNMTNG